MMPPKKLQPSKFPLSVLELGSAAFGMVLGVDGVGVIIGVVVALVGAMVFILVLSEGVFFFTVVEFVDETEGSDLKTKLLLARGVLDVFVVEPNLWQDSDDMSTANLTDFNLTRLSSLQTSIVSWNDKI